MRYKSVAKRKIIELEETLDYSDGQAVGFGSAKGRGGLGRPDIRGLRHMEANFLDALTVLIAQHAFHGETTTPTNNDSDS
jgi:hypothetical protein